MMNRFGVIRLDLQDQTIELLGGLQPAGLVVLDRGRQGFGDGCHDADYDPTIGGPQRVSSERASASPGGFF
jgi:hypothetical protein